MPARRGLIGPRHTATFLCASDDRHLKEAAGFTTSPSAAVTVRGAGPRRRWRQETRDHHHVARAAPPIAVHHAPRRQNKTSSARLSASTSVPKRAAPIVRQKTIIALLAHRRSSTRSSHLRREGGFSTRSNAGSTKSPATVSFSNSVTENPCVRPQQKDQTRGCFIIQASWVRQRLRDDDQRDTRDLRAFDALQQTPHRHQRTRRLLPRSSNEKSTESTSTVRLARRSPAPFCAREERSSFSSMLHLTRSSDCDYSPTERSLAVTKVRDRSPRPAASEETQTSPKQHSRLVLRRSNGSSPCRSPAPVCVREERSSFSMMRRSDPRPAASEETQNIAEAAIQARSPSLKRIVRFRSSIWFTSSSSNATLFECSIGFPDVIHGEKRYRGCGIQPQMLPNGQMVGCDHCSASTASSKFDMNQPLLLKRGPRPPPAIKIAIHSVSPVTHRLRPPTETWSSTIDILSSTSAFTAGPATLSSTSASTAGALRIPSPPQRTNGFHERPSLI